MTKSSTIGMTAVWNTSMSNLDTQAQSGMSLAQISVIAIAGMMILGIVAGFGLR